MNRRNFLQVATVGLLGSAAAVVAGKPQEEASFEVVTGDYVGLQFFAKHNDSHASPAMTEDKVAEYVQRALAETFAKL